MIVITAEFNQLSRLAVDLERGPERVAKETEQVVKRGALNIKKGWARRWRGFEHAPHLPRSISFDVAAGGGMVEAEIGPDKNRPQGALGNLLEYGSINNPPHPAGLPELRLEEPRFVSALLEVVERGPGL